MKGLPAWFYRSVFPGSKANILLVAGALAGVVSSALAQTAQPGVVLPTAAPDRHRISSGDLVHIKVFQEDDLESTLRVAGDGTIVFPLVGAVKIGGQNAEEAARTLREALKRGYLRNPQPSVTVITASQRRFTILGEVQKPGAIEMPPRDKITLLEAIGLGGGYTPFADDKSILVRREENGRETLRKLNARDMARGKASADFEVQPGDVITVGRALF